MKLIILLCLMFAVAACPLQAGRILGSVQFESDPVGSPPLGGTLTPKGCASITDQTAFLGKQCLAVGGINLPATVEWHDYFPDLFSGWYRQASNIPLFVRVAACAAQNNKILGLRLGTGGGFTAVYLQFTAEGNLAAITADGPKTLLPYEAGKWYQFEVTLKCMEPKYQLVVRDAKGTELVRVNDLKWYQPELIDGCLAGVAFTAQEGGKLFVDDFVVQEVNPAQKYPWPRRLISYPTL